MQVEGTVERVRFRNAENGWSVFVLSTEDGPLTCVGTFFALDEGMPLKLSGEIVYHPKYGEQLKVASYEKGEESTEAELERYLASDAIPHIGPKRAAKLVQKYGVNVIDVILNEPEALESLRGIGPKKAEAVRQAIREQESLRSTLIYIQSLGVGPRTAQEILNVYGKDAEEKINQDPYRLVDEVRGIGFVTADAIARKLGVEADSMTRTRAAVMYLFEHAAVSEGACFLTDAQMEQGVARLLSEVPETLPVALADLELAGKLVAQPEKGRHALWRLDTAERQAAFRLMELLRAPGAPLALDAEALEAKVGLVLDETQKNAILMAATERVLVVTGGPGTGKTTIVRAILALFDQNRLETQLAAPTGRAAKRLEQATTREALTVHRLLGYRGGDAGIAVGPTVNAENPLDADAVIVDEMSMVDLPLLAALLDGVADGTRLVLVGDADQLPSVGAGNVLHDLIASEVIPVVRLTQIYRQAERSMIVVNAHRVRRGLEPLVNDASGDFFFLPASQPRDAADLIEDLVTRRLPEHYGLNPQQDIQVLSAMKKGECGVWALNQRLQRALNPKRPEKRELLSGETTFREGDQVMQTRNNYDLAWLDDEARSGEGVYNGDFGLLTTIDPEEAFLEVNFDGRVATYPPTAFRELDLSYAITIHKSQGSEFPCVVIAIVPGAPILQTRQILYTAMTRARQLCVLVGDPATLRRMVENNQTQRRNSALDEKLRALAEGTDLWEEMPTDEAWADEGWAGDAVPPDGAWPDDFGAP
ncbi:MAG: ATP-dependent RecD-like DNA helicase [Peptoniphilaceae bacterium]|nr:ATP-dependent RecD-like DNA helicase [Peptoniphilaceae bacterium]MDY6086241.1 ATP-dependent RecD-like DNA helicase [Peptoniphilaceae bacterium]